MTERFNHETRGYPVADAEAGFGGVLNAFELMKNMIAAGASALGVVGRAGELHDLRRTGRHLDEFMENVQTRSTPSRTAADRYEILHTGGKNYTIEGGGVRVNIDGYRGHTILEAKHVGSPGRSPYVPGSDVPEFVRGSVLESLQQELRRLNSVIRDPRTPFRNIEVITNSEPASQLFSVMMRRLRVPGRARVRN